MTKIGNWMWRLSIVVFFVCADLTFANDDLWRAIIAAQSEREKILHNGHFVWHEHDVWQGEVTDAEYEYWARDGCYFRLDRKRMVNGKQDGNILRYLVRPDGYAQIVASNAADVGTVISVNRVAKGKRDIMRRLFMSMASQVGGRTVRDWVQKWNEGKKPNDDIKSFSARREGADRVVMSIKREVPEGTRSLEAVLSDDFRVLSETYRFAGREGTSWEGRRAFERTDNTYDEKNADIPAKQITTSESDFVEGSGPADRPRGGNAMHELREYQLDPAAEGLFFPDEFRRPSGFSTAWARRGGLLALGLLLLGVYFYRRDKK